MFSLINIGITLLVILGIIMFFAGIGCLLDDKLFDKPVNFLEWVGLISAWLIVALLICLIFLFLLCLVYYCITKPIQCNLINNDSEECLLGDSSNE